MERRVFSLKTLLAALFIFTLVFAVDCTDPKYANHPDCTGINPGGQGGINWPGGAGGAPGQIEAALRSLCSMVKNALAVGMMLMVVSSAFVYSIGQVMGAETRARASVWATSMFNGAIIAALIYLLVPFVLRTMLAGSLTVDANVC